MNLYYLKEDRRGSGLGKLLDDYVSKYFIERGFEKIRLSVSPTNKRALGYYQKFGWMDIGPRLDHLEVQLMEKSLSNL